MTTTAAIHSPTFQLQLKLNAQESEPFGQVGVRQFFFPVLSWICLICFSITLALWYRSTTYGDRFALRQGDNVLMFESVAGAARLQLLSAAGPRFEKGWSYGGGRGGRWLRDTWQDSPLKTIGIELRLASIEPADRGGYWLRIKWYFAAAVFGIMPLTRCVLRLRRNRAIA